jgi:hypothetical protein
MSSELRKKYLVSVGGGLPVFGLWWHRYFYAKRKPKFRHFKILGVQIVITGYKRARTVR